MKSTRQKLKVYLLTIFFIGANILYARETTTKKYSENTDGVLTDIAGFIKSGSWHLLNSFFSSKEDYNAFISYFIYPQGHPKIKKIEDANNTSLLAKMKPLQFKRLGNDTLYILNMEDHKMIGIFFTINENSKKITSYTIHQE